MASRVFDVSLSIRFHCFPPLRMHKCPCTHAHMHMCTHVYSHMPALGACLCMYMRACRCAQMSLMCFFTHMRMRLCAHVCMPCAEGHSCRQKRLHNLQETLRIWRVSSATKSRPIRGRAMRVRASERWVAHCTPDTHIPSCAHMSRLVPAFSISHQPRWALGVCQLLDAKLEQRQRRKVLLLLMDLSTLVHKSADKLGFWWGIIKTVFDEIDLVVLLGFWFDFLNSFVIYCHFDYLFLQKMWKI